jgi:hypothetical protein
LLRETVVEALYNPTVRARIMLEFLVKNLLGNMSLIPTNKLFKSPLGLIFECCGIVRDVPIEINETEVHLDFHIFDILDFKLLIGYPFEKLFQVKCTHGSLGEEFGKTASATHLENPMTEHYPNHNSSEEVKFISPFISPRFSSETECPPAPSREPKLCPSNHPYIVLDNGQDSTLILHNISFGKQNSCAMDMFLSTLHSYEEHNHYHSSFINFLEGWLWMHMFIINIVNS